MFEVLAESLRGEQAMSTFRELGCSCGAVICPFESWGWVWWGLALSWGWWGWGWE